MTVCRLPSRQSQYKYICLWRILAENDFYMRRLLNTAAIWWRVAMAEISAAGYLNLKTMPACAVT
jgi:hypothetical protein